ncbi:MAG: hypothetical protein Ta2B_05570 [Termitinemataceae bacterium]|nr:MAG: hypothetical protein Ta2B_05570 [Termitinemataceae bacterium]
MFKKKLVLCVVLFAICFAKVNAQMWVFDSFVMGAVEQTGLDQALSLAQMIENGVNQIQQAYQTYEETVKLAQASWQNMQKIKDVSSWDDFMAWNNRQLYMERQVENRFKDIHVSVGGKDYGVMQAMDLPNAYSEESRRLFNDYTEEDRYKMYTTLGLTPANYYYVKTWQERENEFFKWAATKVEVTNAENKTQGEKLAEMEAAADEKNNSTDALLQTLAHISAQGVRQGMAINENLAAMNAHLADEAMKGRDTGTPLTQGSDSLFGHNSAFDFEDPNELKPWYKQPVEPKK